ncbi:hypothetical protein CAP47_07060 [Psychroflexus sp. S27]|uniref:hypothetical protein n=1 Tax=Psychroflexus sp. S27 TaxID=1982757 RepID=UPI000C2A9A3E|nr:hypothetical protein [Psychroflexus sp. S27]PJX22778.1 hypothetical protein CAP47_07060 [Psychroflexus sp. S27]
MRTISIKTELKKQVIYNNPHHFWSWFKQDLYMVQNYPSLNSVRDFAVWFSTHLYYYCKGIGFKIVVSSEVIDINFYAGGNPKFIEAIVSLVCKAPKLDNIKIKSFQEADITVKDIKEELIIIKTDNLRIQFNELRYAVDEICQESRRFGITIYYSEFIFIKDKATLINEIYEHLVRYLGEQFIFKKIMYINFASCYPNNNYQPVSYLKQDLNNDVIYFLDSVKSIDI